MKCVSTLSTVRSSESAVAEVVAGLSDDLKGVRADLALVFSSPDHVEALGRLSADLLGKGLARHVLGCTGESIVGADKEVEGSPALSLWAVELPGATLTPRRLSYDKDGLHGVDLPNAPANPAGSRPTWIVLGDPFSFPDALLNRINEDAPGLRVVGGMASAAQSPGGNRLLLDEKVYRDGAVAIEVSGPLALRTVVSQGCRPIGRPMIVTKAEENIIRELGRRPAPEVVREMFEALDPDDQSLVQEGLHIGRVINEYQDKFRRGDFLVRNVLGADDEGGLAITDVIRVGQTVQFHVRDAETADEDLRTLLEDERLSRPSARIRGALLFSCNGRGTRLFAGPDHDVATIHRQVGKIPVAGFFAMGELGPVGGQNFMHGFTASVVLFEEGAYGATSA